MNDIAEAVETLNADRALVNEEANYASVSDQIKIGESSIEEAEAEIKRYREHISRTRADVRRLKARRRVFARAKFALELINEEFQE